MDLEGVNKEYLEAKAGLAKLSAEVEELSKKLRIADINKRHHEVLRDKAELKGDKTKKEAEQAKIDKIVEEIARISKDLEKKKLEVRIFEVTINIKIEEIKQDPTMKQTMNEALAKRYERQIKKYNKEKEAALLEKDAKMSEKNRFEALKQLITEHPALENNLKGIISAKETIKKLNDELSTLDYQKDAKRIAEITGKEMKEATEKLNKNKEPLMNYINKNNINVKFEDIEKLAETGLSLDDTIAGLGAEIKGYDKRIKGYDKSIRNYSVALENIRGELEQQQDVSQTTSGPQNPPNKPKWYQFGKRFKNWMEQRKQAKLPNPAQNTTQQTQRPDTIRDALKYDIVRELVGYDDKGSHKFGTIEQQQLHKATGRKGKEEGPEK